MVISSPIYSYIKKGVNLLLKINKVNDDGREKSERISQEFSPVFWPHQCVS